MRRSNHRNVQIPSGRTIASKNRDYNTSSNERHPRYNDTFQRRGGIVRRDSLLRIRKKFDIFAAAVDRFNENKRASGSFGWTLCLVKILTRWIVLPKWEMLLCHEQGKRLKPITEIWNSGVFSVSWVSWYRSTWRRIFLRRREVEKIVFTSFQFERNIFIFKKYDKKNDPIMLIVILGESLTCVHILTEDSSCQRNHSFFYNFIQFNPVENTYRLLKIHEKLKFLVIFIYIYFTNDIMKRNDFWNIVFNVTNFFRIINSTNILQFLRNDYHIP